MKKNKLSLFEAFGIELEYMIVGRDTLAVQPLADRLLEAESGGFGDVERGPVAWSNELVLHVIELKTNGPAAELAPLPGAFDRDVRHINARLAPMDARLMPTAMHPLMDPAKETRLWPHDFSEVYEAFNRIFDCRGHGWSNLQSTHINLPFADDAEFGRLHAAIRLLLPLLPALAASSPLMDGRVAPALCQRMNVYRNNAIRVPSVAGHLVPERAWTRKEYEMNILARIYQDLAPEDPDGTLQHEWANARGAIARFERDAIEIRLLDVQETPLADIAIAGLTTAVLRALVAERWSPLDSQQAWAVAPLANILRATIMQGHEAVIEDAGYLRALGFTSAPRCRAGELWQHLLETVWPSAETVPQAWRQALHVILQQGPLAKRILQALGRDTSRDHIRHVYRDLCQCLAEGKLFQP